MIQGNLIVIKHTILSIIYCAITVAAVAAAELGGGFVHPGISHNSAELEFIKTKLKTGEQPWQNAWDQLHDSSFAALSWKPRPVAHVERGAYNKPDIGGDFFLSDGYAAYTHALIWCLTGEEAHAVQAAEILNAWSVTLESIGNHDARLLVGMGGINYCNAAELLKHTWNKWPDEEQDAFRTMLRQVLYPVIEGFYPTANGNWDASMIQTMMAIGIHLDDTSIFQKAVDYFLEGEGNGAVNHYFNQFGQCQESGRDQGHTQMGLEYLVNSSEIAWKQGIDLYKAYDYLLAKGFEYTARYNVGEDVPFEYYESFRGRYKHHRISDKGRGRLRAMYERAYNHYHNRMGMDMPWCEKVIEKTRPERGGLSSLPWSTLMFANQPSDLVKLAKADNKSTKGSEEIPNDRLSPVAIESEGN